MSTVTETTTNSAVKLSHRMVTRSRSGAVSKPTPAGAAFAQGVRRRKTGHGSIKVGNGAADGRQSASAPPNTLPLDPQLMTEDDGIMDAEGEFDGDGEEHTHHHPQAHALLQALAQHQREFESAPMESIIYTASAPPPPPPPGTPSDTVYTFIGPANLTTSRPYKSRIALPVPVPNLTKKSRGRRVPTTVTGVKLVEPEGVQKPQRLYRCSVENCGKCFSRGEHLKRHIRSIHTYDKPFPCTHPGCEKYFSRHDNLLQHQKVHKMSSADDEPAAPPTKPLTKPPRQKQLTWRQQGPPMTMSLDTTLLAPSMQSSSLRVHPPTFRSIAIPYYHSGPSEPVSSSVNLAVSSLRTQVDSPPHSFQSLPIDTHMPMHTTA